MSSPEFLYNIILLVGDERIGIDWGNHKGWQEDHKEVLGSLDAMWLFPKRDDSRVPRVGVSLGSERQWILFSRVFGTTGPGGERQVRIYALGWQEMVGQRSVKHLMWIYPTGEIEMAEEPSFINAFFS